MQYGKEYKGLYVAATKENDRLKHALALAEADAASLRNDGLAYNAAIQRREAVIASQRTALAQAKSDIHKLVDSLMYEKQDVYMQMTGWKGKHRLSF